MPRVQRFKGEFSTYHIVQRGNERKNIFWCDEDKGRFLEKLAKAREKYNFLIYAYCLMDNHLHLLIYDNGNDISQIMKSINVSYVMYFNRVYQRCGHLFQDRFKSELVLDDPYLLEVSRYIHNNPVKAGMVKKPAEYKWSSYNIYAGKIHDYQSLVDIERILSSFADSKITARLEYEKFVSNDSLLDDKILDIKEEQWDFRSDNHDYIRDISAAKAHLEIMLVEEKITMEYLKKNKLRRNEMIRTFRKNSSLNLKELGYLFGEISESQVSRILGK
ncbi:MAG: transposase [Bacillota bacterium]|nr:transposase [Bacillota bacterium]